MEREKFEVEKILELKFLHRSKSALPTLQKFEVQRLLFRKNSTTFGKFDKVSAIGLFKGWEHFVSGEILVNFLKVNSCLTGNKEA